MAPLKEPPAQRLARRGRHAPGIARGCTQHPYADERAFEIDGFTFVSGNLVSFARLPL
jgi:hypothetical protein